MVWESAPGEGVPPGEEGFGFRREVTGRSRATDMTGDPAEGVRAYVLPDLHDPGPAPQESDAGSNGSGSGRAIGLGAVGEGAEDGRRRRVRDGGANSAQGVKEVSRRRCHGERVVNVPAGGGRWA